MPSVDSTNGSSVMRGTFQKKFTIYDGLRKSSLEGGMVSHKGGRLTEECNEANFAVSYV